MTYCFLYPIVYNLSHAHNVHSYCLTACTALPWSHYLLLTPGIPGTGLVDWACRLFVASSRQRRVLAFPTTEGPSFGGHLKEFCQQFLGLLFPPPSRRAYDPLNDLHMSDLSVRFMGTSHDKLRRTIELNRGLAPATGRVPTLNFPQGKFRQGKTPKVSKDKVHHLHCASICEVVFTDTFESGDHRYAYGQAFLDFRSRWGDVTPLRSRTQVGWALFRGVCLPQLLSSDPDSRQHCQESGRGLDVGMSPPRDPERVHMPVHVAAGSG